MNLKHFKKEIEQLKCVCVCVCGFGWHSLQRTQKRTSESGLSVISVTLSVRLHLTNERRWQLAPSSPGSAEWDRFVLRPLSGPLSLCSSPFSSVSFFLSSFFPSHRVSGRAMATGQPQGHLLAFSMVMNWPWGTRCLQIASEMKRFWMLHSHLLLPPPPQKRTGNCRSCQSGKDSRGNVTMSEMKKNRKRKVGRVNMSAEWA